MSSSGTSIHCDCCGREKLGEIHPHECLEIVDRRHGQHHVARLSPLEVVQRLAGTTGRDAVLRYVALVMK
mgnify:CR=1 FL=1